MASAVPSIARLNRLYDRATSLVALGVWECDLDTSALTWTNGVYQLFGLSPLIAPDRAATVELYHEESRREMEALRAEAIATGRGFVLDARIQTVSGVERWMRLTADVEHDDGRPRWLYGAKQDITEDRARIDRLRDLAERDPLTGLANRGMFQAAFYDLSETLFRARGLSALILIDLDDFKQVNDRLGHSAGDECLRQIAARLRHLFGDAFLVSRIGGDEFAILLNAAVDRDELMLRLGKALAVLRFPVFWRGKPVDVGASAGATLLACEDPHDPVLRFGEADAALYLAKADGRGTARIFAPDHSVQPVATSVAAAAALRSPRGWASTPSLGLVRQVGS
ncbi:diguanylate cyclase [Sphingomonas sp. So64.6b]|uniref:diguanylate cyclase domain-containing protein n=1 Tax=Sphingomonas sp. So64.6b TaxID=2997354 RepID=UPI001600A6A8|nr:diguanylate cyclase [Sphingomonas sp. So64.6b]QNA83497.1 diguanylate cyclase [Sphingomonas sp. So64.6b]